jgi:hypothetical protein
VYGKENEYWKDKCNIEEKNTEIQQQSVNVIILNQSPKNERKECVSIQRYVFRKLKTYPNLSPVAVAVVADAVYRPETLKYCQTLANLLNCQLKPRAEISDYQYRKLPRLKLYGRTYCISKKTHT